MTPPSREFCRQVKRSIREGEEKLVVFVDVALVALASKHRRGMKRLREVQWEHPRAVRWIIRCAEKQLMLFSRAEVDELEAVFRLGGLRAMNEWARAHGRSPIAEWGGNSVGADLAWRDLVG